MWVKQPGIPTGVDYDFTTPDLKRAQGIAMAFINNQTVTDDDKDFYNKSESNIKVVFLEEIKKNQDDAKVNVDLLKKIDDEMNITTTVDPEVKQRWFPLGIVKKYDPVTQPAYDFISNMGR